ncbi:Rv3235 family protein, partial [Streptomyces sp. H27-D2]|uniref:Rv3235 family protein n=1 Tax=Streptomyces sp. H27-D2 TaxID=3046304 RepID=UPI002DBC457B
GHSLGSAYDQLAQLAPGTPLRPAAAVRSTPVVTRCGEFRPGPGVIEAFARILSGDRVHALAFRLELGADQRWRCAAVELGARP